MYGECCSGDIDEGGVCCDGEVDQCGVCQGDGGSCSLMININLEFDAEDVLSGTGRKLLSTDSVEKHLQGEVSKVLGVENMVVQLTENNSQGMPF